MITNRREREAAQREAFAERRRREDAAPRLRDAAPSLVTLRLRFEDVKSDSQMTAVQYTRLIVVATAPAYFEVPCTEPRCDGRHDLTLPILRALRASEERSSGESYCGSLLGDGRCERTLAYTCEATYRR